MTHPTCPHCAGHGYVPDPFGDRTLEAVPCPACDGTGLAATPPTASLLWRRVERLTAAIARERDPARVVVLARRWCVAMRRVRRELTR